MSKPLMSAAVIIAGLSVGALAANQVVHQQGRAFSSESITLKKGEALTFLNDDTVPHNVFSTSQGNEFKLGFAVSGKFDGRDVQGGGRCIGDLRHSSADEDDGESYRVIAPGRRRRL